MRSGQPCRAQPVSAPSSRFALAGPSGPGRVAGATVLLPQPALHSAHLCRTAAGAGDAPRAPNLSAGRGSGPGRRGAGRRGRGQAAATPGHADQRRQRAAPGPAHDPARGTATPHCCHRRLGPAQGTHLRHDRGGPGAPPRGRPAGRPHQRDSSGLAAAAARDRGDRARPLQRVCPCRFPGCVRGGAGRRPLARADQRARHAGALAGPRPCPAAPPAATARGRRTPSRRAHPRFPARAHRRGRGGGQPRALACRLPGRATASPGRRQPERHLPRHGPRARDGAEVRPLRVLPRTRRTQAATQHPRPVPASPRPAPGRGLRGRDGPLARIAGRGIPARTQDGAALGGREPHQAGAADGTQVAG